jgi:hypothetical protein
VVDFSRLTLYVYPRAGSSPGTASRGRVYAVGQTVAELLARGAVFEEYDYGDAFRTVDGIATSADGHKMAWLKDPDGNILSIGSR